MNVEIKEQQNKRTFELRVFFLFILCLFRMRNVKNFIASTEKQSTKKYNEEFETEENKQNSNEENKRINDWHM